MSLDRTLQRVWYRRSPLALFIVLIPLSWLFALIVRLRRAAFGVGLAKSHRVGCPVVVVGNITVGGTGKTPLVIWIAEFFAARGLKVGIVTRGYGGASARWPIAVTEDAKSSEVGDEAALLRQRTAALVVAGPDRVAAAEHAIRLGARVIVSDDGLQHYRLQRDREIVVIDATRELGNAWLLPAGPLREPASRLSNVDLIVRSMRGAAHVQATNDREAHAYHDLGEALNLATGERRSLDSFAGTRVHALAAIGNPEAFFDMLRTRGLTVDPHPFADHATLSGADISFPDAAPVLMTEKDAVKCVGLAMQQHWAVRLKVQFDPLDERKLERVLAGLLDNLPGPDAR